MIKVLIAIPTAEYARRADFYDYFNMLRKPDGSIIISAHGQSPARNRNIMIEQALAHECSHILFLDDDVTFEPDLLERLLYHDKDIVGGLYLMRNYPNKGILFDFADEEGRCRHLNLNGQIAGLIEVVATGLGAVLIKTDVFRKLEKPWIRLGELEKDHWCDDIGFFRRVREAGYKAYIDLDCLVGHIASVIVRPAKINGKWHVSYDTSGEGLVWFPIP